MAIEATGAISDGSAAPMAATLPARRYTAHNGWQPPAMDHNSAACSAELSVPRAGLASLFHDPLIVGYLQKLVEQTARLICWAGKCGPPGGQVVSQVGQTCPATDRDLELWMPESNDQPMVPSGLPPEVPYEWIRLPVRHLAQMIWWYFTHSYTPSLFLAFSHFGQDVRAISFCPLSTGPRQPNGRAGHA